MADDLDSLWTLCNNCFEDPLLGETIIVVDALDECDKEHREHLMRWIQAVFKHRSDRGLSPLRLIMTGRPDTFSIKQLGSITLSLRLDEDALATKAVSNDVDRVIDARISELAHNRDDFQDDARLWLKGHLKENAGKTFLWVSYALQQLENASSLSRATIRARLGNLPTNLSDLYSRSLMHIPIDDRPASKALLCLIAAAKRPLTCIDLNWASAMLLAEGDVESADGYIQSHFEISIRKLCGHMVDITDERVFFSHRTFRDFLMPSQRNLTSDLPWYIFTELEANIEIIKCCTWRLQSLGMATSDMPPAPAGSLSIIAQDRGQFKSDRQYFLNLEHQNPFTEYTVTTLADQYSDVEAYVSEELICEMQGLYLDEITFKLWCRGYWNERYSSRMSKFKKIFDNLFNARDSSLEKFFEFLEFFEERFEFSASAPRMMSRNKHVRLLHHLIDLDPSLCQKLLPDGWTVLNTVIDMGQIQLVSKVLDQGAEIDVISLGSAPLHRAVIKGDLELIKTLIERKADVNIRNEDGNAPLHSAARRANIQVLRLLLSSGAAVDVQDNRKETPLHKAASRGLTEVVVLLREYGSDTEIRNSDSAVPLLNAVSGGREAAVRLLLKYTTREDLQNTESAFLHAAVRAKNSTIVALLVDAVLDVNMKDKHGRTAFSYIGSKCDRSVCEALLDKGANVNARDEDGATLLHKSATADDLDTMQLLLDRGADVDSLTNDSDTVLHYAVAHGGHEDVFKFLLDNGADIEARNRIGETPLLKAVSSWRSQTTIGLLHKMNANLEARNDQKLTPLQVAIQRQNAGLTLDLLRRKADISVQTDDGQGLMELAERSFLENFIGFRRKGSQKSNYQLYALTTGRDDNLLQKYPGVLEQAMIQKVDMIQEILQAFGVKGEAYPKTKPEKHTQDKPSTDALTPD